MTPGLRSPTARYDGRRGSDRGDDVYGPRPMNEWSVSRRGFLGVGLAGLATATGLIDGCSAKSAAKHLRSNSPPRAVEPLLTPTASWLVAENQLHGAAGWQVPDADPVVWDKIRGFASATSVASGGSVQLFVSTDAPEWRVEAYRIGWYQGHGARLVWTSPTQKGTRQPDAVTDPFTNMRHAPWTPSLEVTCDTGWPPGQYLLKLVSSDGGQTYVPLVVRDDASRAALLVQSSVTTWQAYNQWGGASLYQGVDGKPSGRSKVVSFDRPYYRKGSGEFFGREYEFILFAERHGLDVTYRTNIDVHETPSRLTNHAAFVSLAHDEYYSTAQRKAVTAARDSGVNLVFFGANACFRKIRLEPSPLGPHRQQVNYRVAKDDPLLLTDPSEVTVNWRVAPSSDPESSLIGDYYESNPVDASMVIVNARSWLFDGSGLRDGDQLAHLVGNEYDRVSLRAPTPPNIEVLCHSPVVCNGKHSYSDVTWYTAPSGAGVFATGTFGWIPRLAADTSARRPSAGDPEAAIQRITANLLAAVASGPAGRNHPSKNNLKSLGIGRDAPLPLPSDATRETEH